MIGRTFASSWRTAWFARHSCVFFKNVAPAAPCALSLCGPDCQWNALSDRPRFNAESHDATAADYFHCRKGIYQQRNRCAVGFVGIHSQESYLPPHERTFVKSSNFHGGKRPMTTCPAASGNPSARSFREAEATKCPLQRLRYYQLKVLLTS